MRQACAVFFHKNGNAPVACHTPGNMLAHWPGVAAGRISSLYDISTQTAILRGVKIAQILSS